MLKVWGSILVVACLWWTQAWGAGGIEQLRQDIEQAKGRSVAKYAPLTLARAEAYLGAAMLARDGHQDKEEQLALQRAEETLQEAQASAERFQQSFQPLIQQRQKLDMLLSLLPDEPAERQQASPRLKMKDAVQAFQQVVRLSETGKLNESQVQARTVAQRFAEVENMALPYVLDDMQHTLSKAAMLGAKRYAPVTYAKAKAGKKALEAYVNQSPEGSPKPENLIQTVRQAKQALHIARLVKQWRSDKGSYEQLFLQNQQTRKRIAEALQLDVSQDYSTEALVEAIQKQNKRTHQQLAVATQQLRDLKVSCEQDKQQALTALKASLLAERNTQLAAMKDAFRAKLERETFELKRQKRLRALFPDKRIKIIAHLDGSLLIRLAPLKFAPGSSKLDAKYFDLLGRLKDAMDIYGDRTFRIEGHTDSAGDVRANQKLSLKRAEAVRDFLIAAGVDATSLKALGYGEVRPIASNEFAKGREMNRRIDVVIEARGE